MAFGALILGTLAGIAAGLVAVLALGLPVWAGLLAWWGVGTAATVLPLLALALRPGAEVLPEGLAAA